MKKDLQIKAFMQAHQPKPSDEGAFENKLRDKLMYYHHYERLARELEAEKKRNHWLTAAFLVLSFVCLSLLVLLLKQPFIARVSAILVQITGIENTVLWLLLSLYAATITLLACKYHTATNRW